MIRQAVDVSVVVPCFRGDETLPELCRRLTTTLESLDVEFEILLVDDSGRAAMWRCIEGLARGDGRVRGLQLTRNFGQHNATVCGFRHASGRWVVTLDEDLQNPPEEIPTLLDCQGASGADVVYGTPRVRQGPLWRTLASRAIMTIPRSVMRIGFDISAFRLIDGRIAAEVARNERYDIILDICLSWITDRISSVEVRHDSRRGSPSAYTLSRLTTVFFNLLFNYATFPLRLAAVSGIALSMVALLLGGAVLVSRVIGHVTVPGWASLAAGVAFSAGLTLVTIGILSEYVLRMFLRINQKPQSVLRSATSPKDAPDGSSPEPASPWRSP